MKKAFFIFRIFVLFFLLSKGAQAEDAYRVYVRQINPAGNIYVLDCKDSKPRCISYVKMDLQDKAGTIAVAMVIENEKMDIRFAAGNEYLSQSETGWRFFYELLSEVKNTTKRIRLYKANPNIKDETPLRMPLVIRPPNEFLAEVEIIIQKK